MRGPLLALLALAVSCARVDAQEGLFRCASDDDCLDDFVCQDGFCRRGEEPIPQPCVPMSCGASGGKIPDGCGGVLDCGPQDWTPIADSRMALPHAYAAWTGRELLVWGGGSIGQTLSEGERYDPVRAEWASVASNAELARNDDMTASPGVWTGRELIVWGGKRPGQCLDTGARYDPATNSWIAMTTLSAPSPRYAHVRVWTGREMIVVGGWCAGSGTELADGGFYDPAADSWRAIQPLPGGRFGAAGVWTGRELLVWGGHHLTLGLDKGLHYDPQTGAWSSMSEPGAPPMRIDASAVWTGKEMIVFGGYSWNGPASDVMGRYDPSTLTWRDMATKDAPGPRVGHAALWTGREMVVWGGLVAAFEGSDLVAGDGARYDPERDVWTRLESGGAPRARSWPTAAWTGQEMIVWGGLDGQRQPLASGALYQPPLDARSDTWVILNPSNPPAGRVDPAMVWTGRELLVWGGAAGGCSTTNSGARFDLSSSSWTATQWFTADGRLEPLFAWTGRELLVWGGKGPQCTGVAGGGRYDPVTNSWTALGSTGQPSARTAATAAWTGREWIIWGGHDGQSVVATGARYNPENDTWTALPFGDAPSARSAPRAVWTGSEMLVWGGLDTSETKPSYPVLGGRYNPRANQWLPLQGGPIGRVGHSVAWTGREMIVWGGTYEDGTTPVTLNAGARYDPRLDTWTAMSFGPLRARYLASAVWTGKEMIVWGGVPDLDDGAAYDARRDQWRMLARPSEFAGRSGHAAVWTGDRMILWGGTASFPSMGVYFP